MSTKQIVTLQIRLEVETSDGAAVIGTDHLARAHFRAENAAARVFLSGDHGGALEVVEKGEGVALPVVAARLTTLPGNMSVSRPPEKKPARRKARK